MSKLGRKLKSLRLSRSLGVRETARLVNTSPSYICHIESGACPDPSPSRIIAFAKCYGVPVAELFNVCNTKRQEDIIGYIVRCWPELAACRKAAIQAMKGPYP